MTQPPLFELTAPMPRMKRPAKHVFEGPRPLSTRECADYIGQELDFIYGLIKDGHLKAEYILRPGKARGTWVIPQENFIACLKKLKWSRIPKIG